MHFPWCLQKCGYCDFLSVAAPREAIEHVKYADAVVHELGRRAGDLGRRTLGSGFFGGGLRLTNSTPGVGLTPAGKVTAIMGVRPLGAVPVVNT